MIKFESYRAEDKGKTGKYGVNSPCSNSNQEMRYAVDKEIPIPDNPRICHINKPKKKTKYPFDEMDIGDSFFVPFEEAVPNKTVLSRIRSAMKAEYAKDFKFIARKMNDGVRVWRTPVAIWEGSPVSTHSDLDNIKSQWSKNYYRY